MAPAQPVESPVSIEIQIQDLHFSRGSRPIFKGVDLCLPAGQVTGIMGPSGTGKTTLLRLISGQLRPDQGRILIDGVDVHRRIYLRWLSSSRRKEALQRRRGQGVAVNAIQPHTAPVALPDDITPDLLEMARKLKAAGLVSTSAG